MTKSLADKARELADPNSDESLLQRVRELERDNAAKDRAIANEKAARSRAEKWLGEMEEKLDRINNSRWTFKPAKKHAKSNGAFSRFIVPDTHGCCIDAPASSTALDDMRAIGPREIVMLGDHLECGGFLAQHWTLGYVAQTAYTFEDDVGAGNDLLDRIHEAAPDAEKHYLEGNHERRLEAFCVTQSLRNGADAAFLLRQFGAESQLNLKERGVSFYKQGQFYMGLPVPATIKLGHCYFTHGHTASKHPASKMVERYGDNVVFGHVHRSDEYSTRTVKNGTIKAWCPGCLCAMQPLWKHTDPTTWNHGYGLQLVQDDGSFLHINVPIIEGRSYLVQLTEHLERKQRGKSKPRGTK